MKKLTLIAAFIGFSSVALFAQTPTGSPPTALPTPALAIAPMKLPPQTQSALIAGQIIQQVTAIHNQANLMINNGAILTNDGWRAAAPGETPTISASDLQVSLGPENVALLRSLSSGPAPAASPEQTPKK